MFGLMLLSLLETIFVMYLIEKDSASQDDEAHKDGSRREDSNKQGKANFHNCHEGETRSQLHLTQHLIKKLLYKAVNWEQCNYLKLENITPVTLDLITKHCWWEGLCPQM